MAFLHGSAKKKWYEITECLGNSTELLKLCLLLHVAMAWQHPQPQQSTITPCKMTCLIFDPEHAVLQCCQWRALCNSQTSFRTFGKSFMLSILRLRNLMPLRLCRRLLLFSVNCFSRLLLPHTHFHHLLTILCSGIPPPPRSCPSGRLISIFKLAKHFCSSSWQQLNLNCHLITQVFLVFIQECSDYIVSLMGISSPGLC